MSKLSGDISEAELTLGVIGTGAIAEALIVGLNEHASFAGQFLISQRSKDRSSELAKRFSNVRVLDDNQQIVDQCDWVFMAVLPVQARETLMLLNFRRDQKLISLVAGISVQDLQDLSSPLTDVRRIIPLPPIENGIGPMPLFPADPAIKALFDRCGKTVVAADEQEFSVYSAVSGLMAAHHEFTATVFQWIVQQSVEIENAATYVTNMFRALAQVECNTSPSKLADLPDDCVTEGGLNEQSVRELRELNFNQMLQVRLDRLYERLQS